MKVVILAGGFGTRISEESHLKPKPMIEIGGKPILWHIMKYYSHFGFNEFIICAGYKQYKIKEFFSNYFLHTSDVSFDYREGNNKVFFYNSKTENWKVSIIDTGLNTMTGGRIKRIANMINEEDFLLTYGDGVSDVNLDKLINTHKKGECLVTLTAVQPGGRFGSLNFKNNYISSFEEKSQESGGWINGGYMVINKKVIDLIDGDNSIFEREPLEKLVKSKQLQAYKHHGFWQCMDTLRDKEYLEKEISDGAAKWIIW
jgi:glucose-1-phosphate cytidylyltransferase